MITDNRGKIYGKNMKVKHVIIVNTSSKNKWNDE